MFLFRVSDQTLLLSPVTSTSGYCFCFGSIPSFILELFLHWSPVAYWTPTHLRISPFSILSFCLLILFMGFSRQEYWSGLPFYSPVDHVLLELSTITHLSWVALQGMAHRFLELDKAVVHVISLSSSALSKSNLRKFLDKWTYFCTLSVWLGSVILSVVWKVNIAKKDTDPNGLCG